MQYFAVSFMAIVYCFVLPEAQQSVWMVAGVSVLACLMEILAARSSSQPCPLTLHNHPEHTNSA